MAASRPDDIKKTLRVVTENIKNAVERRPLNVPPVNPRLVAVSKTKPVQDILTAYNEGQRHFGENYTQELAEKARDSLILEICKDIRWHFIGHLQKNKCKHVVSLPNIFMVETIHHQKIAKALNEQCIKLNRSEKLNVMVQVNTSEEANKHGCKKEDVVDLVSFIKTHCPQLTFVGLMTIGAYGRDPALGPNPDFLALVKSREDLCKQIGLNISDVELSMGMSTDYEHAIELGSANVRVGSTIFGARDQPGTSSASAPVPENQQSQDGSQPAGGSKEDDTSSIQEGLQQIKMDDDKIK